jgi:hypothetical protein
MPALELAQLGYAALVTFNAGAEIGQLLFVAAVLLAIAGLRRFSLPIRGWSRAARGIGTMAAFWWRQRMAPLS